MRHVCSRRKLITDNVPPAFETATLQYFHFCVDHDARWGQWYSLRDVEPPVCALYRYLHHTLRVLVYT
jgi:hypothetical protein